MTDVTKASAVTALMDANTTLNEAAALAWALNRAHSSIEGEGNHAALDRCAGLDSLLSETLGSLAANIAAAEAALCAEQPK